MVLPLDDEHLESLQCTKCRKYLSVFPVKNHATRDVTCGRCSTDDDDDGVRSVRYELIAQKYLFRCVNRYEGCRELLRADEARAHEETCLGNVVSCPKCRDGSDTSILELIWHYKLRHPSSYSKKNSFVARPTGEDAVLHVRDDVVFFVLTRYESDSGVLRCCAVTLTDAEATQAFLVGAGSRFERTERRPCKTITAFDDDYYIIDVDATGPVEVLFELAVSAGARPRRALVQDTGESKKEVIGPIECVDIEKTSEVSASKRKFRIRLSEDFITRFGSGELNEEGTALLHEGGLKVDLTCMNCKELIGLPLFRCITYFLHQMCRNCHMICTVCKMPCRQSDTVGEVYSYLKFPCRWNCGRYFISGLRNHEEICGFRKIKCPKCSAEVGFSFMKRDLLVKHDIDEFCMSYNAQQLKKYFYKYGGDTLYFVLHNTLCYVKCYAEGLVKWKLFPPVDAPRAELKLIYKDPNTQNIHLVLGLKGIPLDNLHLYTPYLIYNHK